MAVNSDRLRYAYHPRLSSEQLEHRLLLTAGGEDCRPVITQTDELVVIVGQASDDMVELTLGEATHRLDFSGFQYEFDAAEVTEFQIGGGFGSNSIRIVGTGLDDVGSALGLNGTLTSASYTVLTFSFQSTTIAGGGGNDYAQIYGSNLDDNLQGLPEASVLTTPDTVLRAEDFQRVDAYGRGGNDYGSIYGTQQRDVVVATNDYVSMTGPGITKLARGFERVDSFGRGGDDFARLFDSPDDDLFVSATDYAYMRTNSRMSYAKGFEEVEAVATLGGVDRAYFYDGATTTETFTAGSGVATISNEEYETSVMNFDRHVAESTGGNDQATLLEFQVSDTFEIATDSFRVAGVNRDDQVIGFANVEMPALESAVAFNLFLARLDGNLPQAMVDELAGRFEDATRNPVNGTDGADELLGTVADDEINAGAANDVVFAMDGDDLIQLGDGNDSVEAMDGADIVFGGTGNDQLKGGDGSDILLGGDGNDIVDGEGGLDFVSSGSGNDLFRFVSLDETVYITDFDINSDRIELINMDPADVTLGQALGALTINHPDGMNIVLLGLAPDLGLDDLRLTFVTGAEQTLFDPDA